MPRYTSRTEYCVTSTTPPYSARAAAHLENYPLGYDPCPARLRELGLGLARSRLRCGALGVGLEQAWPG